MLWVQNEMSYDNYHNNGGIGCYRITNHIPITPEESLDMGKHTLCAVPIRPNRIYRK